MELGCTTVTFGGGIDEKLAAMAGAGFTLTELWPRDLFEHVEGPDFVLAALEKHQLSVSVYQALRNFEGMGPQERDRKLGIAAQLMDQMDLVGCDTLVVAANSDPAASGDIQTCADDLRYLGDLAASRSKRIAYEVVAWARLCNTLEQGAALIEAVDSANVGLMIDSFHLFALHTPMVVLETVPLERIFHVEISDIPIMNLPLIEISRNYRLFPGEGTADIQSFLSALRTLDYQGAVSVEVFNAAYRVAPPTEIATRAYRCLASAVSSLD